MTRYRIEFRVLVDTHIRLTTQFQNKYSALDTLAAYVCGQDRRAIPHSIYPKLVLLSGPTSIVKREIGCVSPCQVVVCLNVARPQGLLTHILHHCYIQHYSTSCLHSMRLYYLHILFLGGSVRRCAVYAMQLTITARGTSYVYPSLSCPRLRHWQWPRSNGVQVAMK